MRGARRPRSTAWFARAAAAVASLPFVALAVAAFAFRWAWPDLLPSEWWWSARERARLPIGWDYLASPASRALEGLATSAVLAAAVTAVGLALAWPAARVLAHERFRGRALVEGAFLTPLLVPELAIGLGLAAWATQVAVVGTPWGVALAHLVPVLPYLVRTLTAVERGFDRDLADAARVHGATAWEVFRYLRLPLLAPGVAAATLFAFLVSVHVVVLTVLIGQGRVETTAVQLFARLGGGGLLDPITAGLALVLTFPALVLLLVLEAALRRRTPLAG